jgi:arylsulfatase A-like enzyme
MIDHGACENMLFTLLLFATYATVCLAIETSKPNVVILFADNLGYNDISLFGSPTARTPNIDSLGFQGIKLNNWNSVAHLCSASRAALLTGKYPIRTGVYPGVFKPDSVYGLLPNETTVAKYFKEEGYATSIVGKWHLGHRPDFLPTNQGFDEWLGVPYHMSGGSVDNHTCAFDASETMWLPLYQDEQIVQQPVRVQDLASLYATRATDFIQRNAETETPFLLYLPFSHVHQLCAPHDSPEQQTCQWGAMGVTSFTDAVDEMDWIAGQVLQALEDSGVANDTFVLFTSDNGPWVAEQSCSGSKGPFEGQW